MPHHLIINGRVHETFAGNPGLHADLLVVEGPSQVQPGWLYDGTTFSPPPEPEPPVPAAVSALQMRRALRQLGKKAQADAFVATLEEEDAETWEYAVMIGRDEPIVGLITAALDLDANDLMRLAATL